MSFLLPLMPAFLFCRFYQNHLFLNILFISGALVSLVMAAKKLSPKPQDEQVLFAALGFRLFCFLGYILFMFNTGDNFFWFLDDRNYFLQGQQIALDPGSWIWGQRSLSAELGTTDLAYFLVNATLQSLFGSHIWVIWWFNFLCGLLATRWTLLMMAKLAPPSSYDVGKWFIAFWPSLVFWSWFDLKDVFVCACTVRILLSALQLMDRVTWKEIVKGGTALVLLENTRGYTAVILFALVMGAMVARLWSYETKRFSKFAIRFFMITSSFLGAALLGTYWLYDLFESFANFQYAEMTGASAQLQSLMTLSNPSELPKTLVAGAAHLLFGPVPWQADGILVGVVPTTLGIVTLLPLVLLGAWDARRGSLPKKWFVLVTLVFVALYSFLWVGSSVRHRLQLEPMLLLVAAMGLSHRFRSLAFALLTPAFLGVYVWLLFGRQTYLLFLLVAFFPLFWLFGRKCQRERLHHLKQPRILEVTNTDFSVRHLLLPLMQFLGNRGFDVTFACPAGKVQQELCQEGYRWHPLFFARSVGSLKNLIALFKFTRELWKEPYHIIHVHTPIVAFYGRIAAFLSCSPAIVYTAHGFYFHDRMPAWKRSIFIWAERFIGWCTDLVFFQSDEDRGEATRLGITSEECAIWVGNGVDPQQFDPHSDQIAGLKIRSDFGIPSEAIVFLYVGRMVREKGILDLLSAFADLKGSEHLMIVGETLPNDYDGISEELEAFIQRRGLQERVHRVGYQPKIVPFLSASDVMVLPSYREGMPRSIIEAMMMGKAVIATNIRGCREEVVDGESGLLFSPGDILGLSAHLERLSKDRSLAKKMGEKGRERALAEFTESQVFERHLKFFEFYVNDLKIEDLTPAALVLDYP